MYLVTFHKTDRWMLGEIVEKKSGQGVDWCYLGYEALCDGHRVGIALLKIMKKVPEANTVMEQRYKCSVYPEFSLSSAHMHILFPFFLQHIKINDSPTIHCSKQWVSGARVTLATEIRAEGTRLWTNGKLPWIQRGISRVGPCVYVCVSAHSGKGHRWELLYHGWSMRS